MEAKAIVMLDGNELEILNRLLIKKSKEAAKVGKWQESEQYIIIADKLADAKEEFHRGHYTLFSQKYGFKQEEKPAQEMQASQG